MKKVDRMMSLQKPAAQLNPKLWHKTLLSTLFVLLIGFGLWFLPQAYYAEDSPGLLPPETLPENAAVELKKYLPDQIKNLIARERGKLAAEPLDRASLLNLAVLFELNGEKDISNQVAVLAANRSLRDLAAQSAALNLSLNKSDYVDAMRRIDGLLRSRPEFSSKIYPTLLAIIAKPAGLDSVVNELINEPPWRTDFMDFAAKQTNQTASFYSIISGLRSKKADVFDRELGSYLTNLISAKAYETAYFVWLDFLSPNELSKVGLIFDGNFDVKARSLYFGWNFDAAPNTDLSIAVRPGTAADQSLKLNFLSAKKSFGVVSQNLRLDVGRYRLSAESYANRLQSSGGLMWRILCTETGLTLGDSPKFLSPSPWQEFVIEFEVPADQCGTQTLKLIWGSPAELDQVVSGQIYFDNFEIALQK